MPQNASPPGRPISVATFCMSALACTVLLYGPGFASRPASAPRPGAVACAGAIQHPLAVHVDALDPIRRGAAVRLRVTTRATRGFERGVVRITSSGGAVVVGASRAELRAVPAGGQTASEFRVAVPAHGGRFLVQFRVEAEGEDGASARGAAYNLLPDGPSEQLREASTASGERVLEVAARRVGR